jgi:hypothetical protein
LNLSAGVEGRRVADRPCTAELASRRIVPDSLWPRVTLSPEIAIAFEPRGKAELARGRLRERPVVQAPVLELPADLDLGLTRRVRCCRSLRAERPHDCRDEEDGESERNRSTSIIVVDPSCDQPRARSRRSAAARSSHRLASSFRVSRGRRGLASVLPTIGAAGKAAAIGAHRHGGWRISPNQREARHRMCTRRRDR